MCKMSWVYAALTGADWSVEWNKGMVIIQLSLLCDSAMFFSYCQLSFYVNFNDEKGIEKTQIH